MSSLSIADMHETNLNSCDSCGMKERFCLCTPSASPPFLLSSPPTAPQPKSPCHLAPPQDRATHSLHELIGHISFPGDWRTFGCKQRCFVYKQTVLFFANNDTFVVSANCLVIRLHFSKSPIPNQSPCPQHSRELSRS